MANETPQQTFTREQVITMLQDMYCQTAESYDDYYRSDSYYDNESVIAVIEFMKNR